MSPHKCAGLIGPTPGQYGHTAKPGSKFQVNVTELPSAVTLVRPFDVVPSSFSSAQRYESTHPPPRAKSRTVSAVNTTSAGVIGVPSLHKASSRMATVTEKVPSPWSVATPGSGLAAVSFDSSKPGALLPNNAGFVAPRT